jgi:phenylpropionate dioxygenase-like ring-hydroxylating dioxygenase large terminal subunit
MLEAGTCEGAPDLPFEVSASEYVDAALYEREIREVVRRGPLPLVATSALGEPGTRTSKEILGVSYLVTRDLEGRLHVFQNRCRHRGAALVGDGECSRGPRLVCPYHGWTYALDGRVAHIPEQDTGFPGVDTEMLSLRRVPSFEAAGTVWILPEGQPTTPPAFAGLHDELESLDLGSYRAADSTSWPAPFNWKIGVNAFLETYHFKVAHSTGIAPHFVWNRILLDSFGDDVRITLPRTSIAQHLATVPPEGWELRSHVTFVYFLFPCSFLSILPDHASFISFVPEGLARSRVESWLLVPEDRLADDSSSTYWHRNAKLFAQTVAEDVALASSIQRGISAGQGGSFLFATYEHGIAHFRESLRRRLG